MVSSGVHFRGSRVERTAALNVMRVNRQPTSNASQHPLENVPDGVKAPRRPASDCRRKRRAGRDRCAVNDEDDEVNLADKWPSLSSG